MIWWKLALKVYENGANIFQWRSFKTAIEKTRCQLSPELIQNIGIPMKNRVLQGIKSSGNTIILFNLKIHPWKILLSIIMGHPILWIIKTDITFNFSSKLTLNDKLYSVYIHKNQIFS